MSPTDPRLLAAFETELGDCLTRLRQPLDRLRSAGRDACAAELKELHRLTHTIKGSGRMLGQTACFELGRRLETAFKQLADQTVQTDTAFFQAVEAALENLGLVRATLRQPGSTVDHTAAATLLDQWLGAAATPTPPTPPPTAAPAPTPAPAPAPTPPPPPAAQPALGTRPPPAPARPSGKQSPDARDRLLRSFAAEFPEYLSAIRQAATALENTPENARSKLLDTAFRAVHNLKGAARVVDLAKVVQLTHLLEDLLGAFSQGSRRLDGGGIREIRRAADGLEDACQAARQTPDTEPAPLAAAIASAPPPAALPESESLRIDAGQLDALLRTGNDLLGELEGAESFSTALNDARHGLEELRQEGMRLRQNLGATFHRLASHPEYGCFVAYCNFVEHHAQLLEQRWQSLLQRQRRHDWSLNALSRRLESQVLDLQTVPAALVLDGLAAMVRELATARQRELEYQAHGLETRVDRRVLQELKAPLIHLLRNAVDHGIEPPAERRKLGKPATAHIQLKIAQHGYRLEIEVADDGQGIRAAKVAAAAVQQNLLRPDQAARFTSDDAAKLIFEPRFSTATQVSDVSGRGIGLSTVTDAMSRLKGRVSVHTVEGQGTRFVLSVPTTAITHRLLVVAWDNARFAFPFEAIEAVASFRAGELSELEGQTVVQRTERHLPLVSLGTLLNLPDVRLRRHAGALPAVILGAADRQLAVAVQHVVGEREAMVQALPGPAANLRQFIGGVLLDDGGVALVLNPEPLAQTRSPTQLQRVEDGQALTPARPHRVLVVDDSFTARTLQAGILEASGYEVAVAVDGRDALRAIRRNRPDLLLVDIQMPRLDGLSLLEEIKRDKALRHLPVVLVSSHDDPAVQRRGLDLGAAAYIVKRNFEHHELLQLVEQLL
jgi:two-component system chemotaxis sensor kinase CheA